jgi:hypothetical protein
MKRFMDGKRSVETGLWSADAAPMRPWGGMPGTMERRPSTALTLSRSLSATPYSAAWTTGSAASRSCVLTYERVETMGTIAGATTRSVGRRASRRERNDSFHTLRAMSRSAGSSESAGAASGILGATGVKRLADDAAKSRSDSKGPRTTSERTAAAPSSSVTSGCPVARRFASAADTPVTRRNANSELFSLSESLIQSVFQMFMRLCSTCDSLPALLPSLGWSSLPSSQTSRGRDTSIGLRIECGQ